MPSLVYLNLSDCNIKTLGSVGTWEGIPHLANLVLSRNNVSDVQELRQLTGCNELAILDLRENPICAANNFTQIMLRYVPSLRVVNEQLVCHVQADKALNQNHEKTTLWAQRTFKTNYMRSNVIEARPLICKMINDMYALNEAMARFDPVLIIQARVRGRAGRRMAEYHSAIYSKAILFLQAFQRGMQVRAAYKIKLGAATLRKRWAVKAIQKSFRITKEFRAALLEKRRLVKPHQAALTIALFLRRLGNFRKIPRSVDDQITILVGKSREREFKGALVLRNVCRLIFDEIHVKLILMGHQVDDFVPASVVERETCFQYLSGAGPSLLCVQRRHKSYRQAQAELHRAFDARYANQNRVLRNALSQSGLGVREQNQHLKSALSTLKVPRSSFDMHREAEGSTDPFFTAISITHKEIKAVVYFLSLRKRANGDSYVGAEVNRALYAKGEELFAMCSLDVQYTLSTLFSQSVVPIRLYHTEYTAQPCYVLPLNGVVEQVSALRIQKILRMHGSNVKLVSKLNAEFNTNRKSISEILLLLRAVKVLQKHFRAHRRLKEYLVTERIRDAFSSAYKHQFFLMSPQMYQKLVGGKLTRQRWIRKADVAISAPVSTQYLSKLFYSRKSEDRELIESLNGRSNLTQFLLLQHKEENAFSALTGNLYGYQSANNQGVAQLNTDQMSMPLLRCGRLHNFVKNPDINSDFRILGIEVESVYNKNPVSDAFLDAMRVMWGAELKAASCKLDQVLDSFRFSAQIRKYSDAQICQMILEDLDVQEFDADLFPSGLRYQAAVTFKGFKVIRKRSRTQQREMGLPAKALLLELRYSDPCLLAGKSRLPFVVRKQLALMDANSGPTCSFQAQLTGVAVLIIQRFARMLIIRKTYLQLPKHTALYRKIKMIQQLSRPVSSEIAAEVEALSMLQLAREQNSRAERLRSAKKKELIEERPASASLMVRPASALPSCGIVQRELPLNRLSKIISRQWRDRTEVMNRQRSAGVRDAIGARPDSAAPKILLTRVQSAITHYKPSLPYVKTVKAALCAGDPVLIPCAPQETSSESGTEHTMMPIDRVSSATLLSATAAASSKAQRERQRQEEAERVARQREKEKEKEQISLETRKLAETARAEQLKNNTLNARERQKHRQQQQLTSQHAVSALKHALKKHM